MKAYIKGSSAITPQNTFEKENYLAPWREVSGGFMSVLSPNYRDFIDPKLSRRMSKIIKMSIATTKSALAEARIDMPGAVIVGTGLGCMADTEKFLREVITTAEGVLSPTAFIQSTHNTVAGQIALLLGCANYNFTYTNRGHSFENALMDALLLLTEGNDNILVGGTEETTEMVFETFLEMGCVGDGMERSDKAMMGEGASFFVISSEGEVAIDSIATYTDILPGDAERAMGEFLEREGLNPSEIDVLVLGLNRDLSDPYYLRAGAFFGGEIPVVRFKNVSGEYFTAAAYGMHLAVAMLEKQKIFDNMLVSGKFSGSMKRILIYNHYKAYSHTFILLSR